MRPRWPALLVLALTAALPAFAADKPVTTNSSAPPAAVAASERSTGDGGVVVEVDLDGDKRPDIFNYYRASGSNRVLLRKEIDLNRDGKIDVRSYYSETAQLEKEEMDGDFDGRFDWVDTYKGGKRVMSEVDSHHTGRFDLVKYYENGKISRKERDTNDDGKVDYWEYFDGSGNVIKTGQDIDGDGIMDVRQE